MKLDNVFFGFTKKGDRKLLWKKYKTEYTTYGDVARTMFFDLEEKKYIDPCYVDETTLVPVVKLVGDVHRMSKRKVIKAYKADCNLLYDVTGSFYGDILNKTTKYDLKTKNGYYMGAGTNDLYDECLVTEKENILFARIADPECRVERVETGVLYPWINNINNGYGVKEVRPIKKELFSKAVMSKKKLLEADYRKVL